MGIMGGFLSFACCFALLLWIWHEHNVFSRRYGLQDGVTVVLNGALLSVVLFYVYPLKFMFDSMFARFVPEVKTRRCRWRCTNLANASAVYALGFIIMFVMFMLLYARAYGKRHELGLTEPEIFDLTSLAGHHMVSTVVGTVALIIAVAAPLPLAFWSPTSLSLMGPGHFAWGMVRARRRKALEADLAVV